MKEEDMYKFLFEAPGDEEEPSDANQPAEETEVTDEPAPADDVNVDDAGGDDTDAPPDLDMGDFSDDSTDDVLGGDDSGEDTSNLKLDEKISSILNVNVYKDCLRLLSDIGTQLNTIKDNVDMFDAITKTTSTFVDSLRKLDNNIREYLTNIFQDTRYENNLLFYNKCKAYYALLNEKFDKEVHKSIHTT